MSSMKTSTFIILAIIFLVIIQILFSIPAPCKYLDAVWEAGDLITFVGTMFLGLVAYNQNKKANHINEKLASLTEQANDLAEKANDMSKDSNAMSSRLMKLEETRYKLETRPFAILSDCHVFEKNSFEIQTKPDALYINIGTGNAETALCIAFQLTNTTQSYISAEYKGVVYADSEEIVNWTHGYSTITNYKLRLNAGQSGLIIYYGQREVFENTLNKGKIKFSFELENRFGEKYKETFDAGNLMMPPPNKGDHPIVIINATNYRIGKYINNKDGQSELYWEET